MPDQRTREKEQPSSEIYERWYGVGRLRIIVWFASFLLYAVVVLTLGKFLMISSNYFVILPVITAALAWGTQGGIVAGILALPSNLALFALIGHPEFAPESLAIAEISGLLIGTTMGLLGSRFRQLGEEIRRRKTSEEELKASLEERDLLIREIQHRVKNNLSVIKSMLYLRMMKTDDEECREAFKDMTNRLMSMALVQDQLNADKTFHETLDLGVYLDQLVENIASSSEDIPVDTAIKVSKDIPELHLDRITPLGILVNEVITNAFKHAFPKTDGPYLSLTAELNGEDIVIVIADNGPGYDGSFDDKRLGRVLMDALASQLRGKITFDGKCGTRVTVRFPLVIA